MFGRCQQSIVPLRRAETWKPVCQYRVHAATVCLGLPKLSPEIALKLWVYLIAPQLIRLVDIYLLLTFDHEWQRVDLSEQNTTTRKQMRKTLSLYCRSACHGNGLNVKGRPACSEVVSCTACWLRHMNVAYVKSKCLCFFFCARLWAAQTPSWSMRPVG